MSVPFHRLTACGSILVAARGASIHTFNALDGSHIAAWQVPAEKAEEKEEKDEEKDEEKEDDKKGESMPQEDEPAEAEAEGDDVPPSKRRRIDEEDKNGNEDQQQESQQPSQNTLTSNGSSKKKRGKSKPKAKQAPAQKVAALRTADLPVVSILEATADGRHLVVMMGHDKTLRVLAHDLQGHLTQLSARVMPKRPCAVAFTADNQTILSGDKFGDVYALPLIEVEKTEEEKAAEKAAKEAAAQAAIDKLAAEVVAPLRLEANKFTVHTKGNLQALENQRRQKELLLKQGLDPLKKDAEASASEYQLLLGHVSMLTAVATANGYKEGESLKSAGKRPLILTADRDEHIRVTRGVVGPTAATSQTHVIETFCLGHTSFVSRLCIPANRPDRLISGGGDGELRVWNFWPKGRLVGTADLASLVAAATGKEADSAKVALSGLYSFGSARNPDAMTDGEATDVIVAICERVPALFFFRLTDGATLAHTQTLQLPEGQLPLDVAEVGESDARRLVVATASAEEASEVSDAPTSLLALTNNKDGWTVAEASSFATLPQPTAQDDPVSATLDRPTLRKLLLQSNESLRKDSENEE